MIDYCFSRNDGKATTEADAMALKIEYGMLCDNRNRSVFSLKGGILLYQLMRWIGDSMIVLIFFFGKGAMINHGK